MKDLLFRNGVYDIIGCAIEVHRVLGSGFLEGVYQEALEHELQQKGISFETNKVLPVIYKGIRLRKEYIADLTRGRSHYQFFKGFELPNWSVDQFR